jgi:hypothetical protein
MMERTPKVSPFMELSFKHSLQISFSSVDPNCSVLTKKEIGEMVFQIHDNVK